LDAERESLAVLKPLFQQLVNTRHQVPVVLIQHPESVSFTDAINLVPWFTFQPEGWGNVRRQESIEQLLLYPRSELYGDSRSYRTFFFIHDANAWQLASDAWNLAAETGALLRDWAKVYGIQEETLRHEPLDSRWLFALFDLAWSETAVFPMEAKRYPLEDTTVASKCSRPNDKDKRAAGKRLLQFIRDACPECSDEDLEDYANHWLDFFPVADRNCFFVFLKDYIRASVFAITALNNPIADSEAIQTSGDSSVAMARRQQTAHRIDGDAHQRIDDEAKEDEEAITATEPTKQGGARPIVKATVNERMAGTIMENHEAMGWNSPQWARHLACAKSTVVETATWKQLESARQQAKAERVKDRRRKPKASDQQRD